MLRWLTRLFFPSAILLLLFSMISMPIFAEQRRRTRSGWIEVSSITMGAEVFIDGESVGTVPLPEKIQVPVGEHTLKMTKRGYTQFLEVVGVKNRRTTTVEADLLALTGILRVETNVSDAQVFIDEDFIGNTPLDYDVEPGVRQIKISLDGYHDHTESVDVMAGEEYEVVADLERLPPEEDPTVIEEPIERRWYQKWWVWTIIGTSVVALSIALPVGLTRDSDHCEDVGWPSCDDAFNVDLR